jgi:hypothetical protein
MNKVLKFLGGLFAAIIVVATGMFAYMAFQGPNLDAEGKTYLEATLPRVMPDLGATNFLSFVAPEDRAKLNAVSLDRFASDIRQRLGAFQSCDDLQKGGFFQLFSVSGANIRVQYLARCQFEKGVAPTTITIRKAGQNGSLMGILFDLNRLEPPMGKPASVRAEALPAPSSERHPYGEVSRLPSSRFVP